MGRLDEIRRTYDTVTKELARVRAKSNPARQREIDQCIRAVDCAFFLLAFGHLEDTLITATNLLIEQKRRLKDPDSRPWKIASGLSLRERLLLLFGEHSDEYRRLDKTYKDRNSIAHAGMLTAPVDMVEFLEWVVTLERTKLKT